MRWHIWITSRANSPLIENDKVGLNTLLIYSIVGCADFEVYSGDIMHRVLAKCIMRTYFDMAHESPDVNSPSIENACLRRLSNSEVDSFDTML